MNIFRLVPPLSIVKEDGKGREDNIRRIRPQTKVVPLKRNISRGIFAALKKKFSDQELVEQFPDIFGDED